MSDRCAALAAATVAQQIFQLNVDRNKTRSSSAHLNMNKVNHIFRSAGWSNSFNLSDSAGLFAQHTTIVLLQSHDFSDVKTQCTTPTLSTTG